MPPPLFCLVASYSPGVFPALAQTEDEEAGVQPRIDQLGGYLDVVETQLMREIACRSRAMFEAAGELHDLHRTLCQTLDQIKVSVKRKCGPTRDATSRYDF